MLNLAPGEPLTWNYKMQTLFMLLARVTGDKDREEDHLNALDAIWRTMSAEEKLECNAWAATDIPRGLI